MFVFARPIAPFLLVNELDQMLEMPQTPEVELGEGPFLAIFHSFTLCLPIFAFFLVFYVRPLNVDRNSVWFVQCSFLSLAFFPFPTYFTFFIEGSSSPEAIKM